MPGNALAVRPDNPRVFARDGQVFADSRDVAEYFGKRHDDVLKKIRNLVAEGVRNFAEGSYVLPETGSQQHPYFMMDRDGFALLAMSFTGAKALRWKLLYVEAFNRMEAELRGRTAQPRLDDPATLRTLLLGYTEQVIDLKAENATLAPKAEALNRIAEMGDSRCIRDTAKHLQMKPIDLTKLAARPQVALPPNRGRPAHRVPGQDRRRPDGAQGNVVPRGAAQSRCKLTVHRPASTC